MALTRDEARAYAASLIEFHNEGYDFNLVYEDEELTNFLQEEQEAVYEEMLSAKISVSWDD